MTLARFVFMAHRNPALRPSTCSMSDKDGTGKSFSSAMPSAGINTKSCRDILEDSAVPSHYQSATATSLAASSLVASAGEHASSNGAGETRQACRRRTSSSNSSRVSFGTIEIHVVEPIAVSVSDSSESTSKTSTTCDCAEDLSSSSSAAKISSTTRRPSSPPSDHKPEERAEAMAKSAQHIIPASRTTHKNTPSALKNKDTTTSSHEQQSEHSPNNTAASTQETSTSPSPVAIAATTPKQPIKCGLEVYERLRPPRRSRTELFLDAVRERSRRKLSHERPSEDVIEAEKSLVEKHHSQAFPVASAATSGHIDNINQCTLRRSDAVMSCSSNLSMEATKNRRSKRLERMQGAAEGEIERSNSGGLRGWSSNFGRGARL